MYKLCVLNLCLIGNVLFCQDSCLCQAEMLRFMMAIILRGMFLWKLVVPNN